ncbi:hypothetical protein BD310DRAFT_826639 [Dichomitus squalens]|uniref:Uncharacterized protein n=1 Tax=Dichomitus squalens TaxID=114155 RepID=A0A4Q9PLQ4_9APHY|nr:hypothetical protein BD310DRAFT_826639 [Dichomitus squalens]
MRFPHLVRHRQLFMQEGALPFIERLLHQWFDAPWSELGSTHRRNVVATIRTLGMLLTEAEMDGLEYIEPTVPDGTLTDRTPFLLFQRPQQTVQQLLSPRSLQLVAHLLTRIRVLPLSLQAFTLRLSVQLGEEESAVLWARFDKHKVFDDFVFRVQNVTVDDGHRAGLIPAVNTVIYLTLCEAAYPLRPSSPSDSNRTVSYWLWSLLHTMNRAPMDSVVLRQICWGMSVLAWTLTPQASGVTARPLIPRLGPESMRQLSRSLTDMLYWDQDEHVLNTVVMAVDSMLYHIGAEVKWNGHGDICEALHSCYCAFLADLLRRLRSGETAAPRISPILPSLIRIPAYLTFFDRNASLDAKVSLTATIFGIFKYLVTAKERPEPESSTMASSHEGPGPDTRRSAVSREEDWMISVYTRRWIYGATCRFVNLYMNDPKWKLDY